MAVKDDLLAWVTTNKNEIIEITDDGLDIYPTFRASEAAADIGVKKESASNALNALQKEGLVENVERGLWSWTGAFPVEAEKAPRKRSAAAPKDPLMAASVNLQKALESVTERINKAITEERKCSDRLAELKDTQARLALEEVRLVNAIDALDSSLT